MLKMSRSKVYDLTARRTRKGDLRQHPLPVLRIDGSLRFRKADVEGWIEQLCRGSR